MLIDLIGLGVSTFLLMVILTVCGGNGTENCRLDFEEMVKPRKYPAQNIYLNHPLLAGLRTVAQNANVSLSKVVRIACEEYLERLFTKQGKPIELLIQKVGKHE